MCRDPAKRFRPIRWFMFIKTKSFIILLFIFLKLIRIVLGANTFCTETGLHVSGVKRGWLHVTHSYILHSLKARIRVKPTNINISWNLVQFTKFQHYQMCRGVLINNISLCNKISLCAGMLTYELLHVFISCFPQPNSRRCSGGLESHCILGTPDERRSTSLSFRCIILPWFERGTHLLLG